MFVAESGSGSSTCGHEKELSLLKEQVRHLEEINGKLSTDLEQMHAADREKARLLAELREQLKQLEGDHAKVGGLYMLSCWGVVHVVMLGGCTCCHVGGLYTLSCWEVVHVVMLGGCTRCHVGGCTCCHVGGLYTLSCWEVVHVVMLGGCTRCHAYIFLPSNIFCFVHLSMREPIVDISLLITSTYYSYNNRYCIK